MVLRWTKAPKRSYLMKDATPAVVDAVCEKIALLGGHVELVLKQMDE